jgi:hypothetical protein
MGASEPGGRSGASASSATWTEVASFPAGRGDVEVGYDLRCLGGGPRGPESLSALPGEGVCLLDSVNGRVHVVGPDGRRTIDLPFATYAVDVLATYDGMHVLHDANEVTEISYKGELVRTTPLPSGMGTNDVLRLSGTRGRSIELWAGNYHVMALEADVPRVQTDRLQRDEPLDEAVESPAPAPLPPWTARAATLVRDGRGVAGPDGRNWMTEFTGETGRIVTSDGEVDIPIVVKATLGSARIAGLDKAGQIYVVVEDVLASGSRSVVEVTVQRYDPAGQLTGVARLPFEEFVAQPARPVEVQPDGSVYVLVPRADATTVYRVELGSTFDDYDSWTRPAPQPAPIEAPHLRSSDIQEADVVDAPEAGTQALDYTIHSRLDTLKRARRMAAPDGDMWAWYPCYEWVPNGEPRPSDAHRPNQFAGFPTQWDGKWRYFRGIPYTWGGFDSPWSHSDWTPWGSWSYHPDHKAALEFYGSGTFKSTRGPLIGKVNTGCTQGGYLPCAGDRATGAYYRYIAGIDCSGFVSAAAGYIPRENSKPGTQELATTAGFDHWSALDSGNVVLNVQPMNYFVGPGHVLYYVGRDTATGGLLTLEATVDGNPQAAKYYTRSWSWIAAWVPSHRGWWPKGPGDSPYFAFTAPGAGKGQYALPGQSVWYKLSVSAPASVRLTNVRSGNVNLFVYRPYAAPNGTTQYELHSSSQNTGTAEEVAEIRSAGTYYARVWIESLSNAPYPATWNISWPAASSAPVPVGAMWLHPDRATHGAPVCTVELVYQDAPETFEALRPRFQQLRNKGVDIWIRVDKVHGQTLPTDGDGRAQFAQFCRRVAADPDYGNAKGLIIGNEPNLTAEGAIPPRWVMTVVCGFDTPAEDRNNVFQQVRAVNSSIRVLVPAVGPWNAQTPGQLDAYPTPPDGRQGLMAWEQYQSTLAWCAYHGSSHWARSDVHFAMHTYSNVAWAGTTPANEPNMEIRNPNWMNAYYGIRVYDDLMYQIRVQAGGETPPNLISEWNSFVEESWPADNYPSGLMPNAISYIRSKPNVLGFAVFIDDHRVSPVWERTAVSAYTSANLSNEQRDRLRAWDGDFDATLASGAAVAWTSSTEPITI